MTRRQWKKQQEAGIPRIAHRSLKLKPVFAHEIVVGRYYLAKLDDEYRVGRFSEAHYGLLFIDHSSNQLDGKDATKWQGLWALPENR